MGMPSGFELLLIVGAILLLFGGKKIPELAKGLGQGIKNFKTALNDDSKDDNVEKIQSTKNEESEKATKKSTKTKA